jgi:hypothetical protein
MSLIMLAASWLGRWLSRRAWTSKLTAGDAALANELERKPFGLVEAGIPSKPELMPIALELDGREDGLSVLLGPLVRRRPTSVGVLALFADAAVAASKVIWVASASSGGDFKGSTLPSREPVLLERGSNQIPPLVCCFSVSLNGISSQFGTTNVSAITSRILLSIARKIRL